jgi:hypothetical protein
LLATVALVLGAASANATTGPSGHLVTTISLGPLTPGQAASPSCAPSLNHFDRTQACWTDNLTILVYTDEGELVGEIHFVLIDSLHLRLTSRSFTENLTVKSVSAVGETPARARDRAVRHRLLPLHPHEVRPGLQRTGLHGAHPWQGAGCVFPNFTPTLTTMVNLKDIAANIRKAQAGPGHGVRPHLPAEQPGCLPEELLLWEPGPQPGRVLGQSLTVFEGAFSAGDGRGLRLGG